MYKDINRRYAQIRWEQWKEYGMNMDINRKYVQGHKQEI